MGDAHSYNHTGMKKIIAYINTVRVHWLVDELEALGIDEIMVTEYFSPSSKISRMELLAQDEAVEDVREIIHRVGTTGLPADHGFFVEEYDPKLPSQIPLGKRTSKLEEIRVKQLVNFMLHGTHRKIRAAFLLMSISVLGVGLFIYAQSTAFQQSAKQNEPFDRGREGFALTPRYGSNCHNGHDMAVGRTERFTSYPETRGRS